MEWRCGSRLWEERGLVGGGGASDAISAASKE
jgi:hypothetical protein